LDKEEMIMASQSITTIENEGGQPLVRLQSQLMERTDQFKMILPGHISPEKFQRTILTAVQSDPDLLSADRRSFLTACMKCGQDGLLPDKREAALVIFVTSKKDGNQWIKTKEVQYMPMVYGLRKKILQSGEVKDIFANVVYRQELEAGLFVYEEGSERALRHKPLLDATFDPCDDDIICAYSIATFSDDSQSFEVMRRSDINKIRQSSQTGALGKEYQGKPRAPKGPWVDWFSEMAKKSVMRRHSKVLPMSGDLIDIEAFDQDLAARSAQAVLTSVDQTPPTRLDHQQAAQVEPEDEETARNLDAQASAAERGLGDDEQVDEDGVVTNSTESLQSSTASSPGAATAGSQQSGEQEASDTQADPRRAMVDGWLSALNGADMARIKLVDAEFVKHRAAMSDDFVAEVEAAIAAARKGVIS
jgi:recombination protein RecT